MLKSQLRGNGRPATTLSSCVRSKSYGIHCDPCSRSERDNVYEIHPKRPVRDWRRRRNSRPYARPVSGVVRRLISICWSDVGITRVVGINVGLGLVTTEVLLTARSKIVGSM